VKVLSSLVASRRRAVLVLLLSIAGAVAVFLAPAPTPLDPRSSTGLGDSYDSVQVERLLGASPERQVQTAVVVLSRDDGTVLSPADVDELTTLLASSAPAQGGGPGPQLAPDGTVALLAVPLPGDLDLEGTAAAVEELRITLTGLPAPLVASVTGQPAFTTDIGAVFEGADVTLLLATVAVVAVLLLITYRSPLLLVVPLAVVAGAEQVVLALVALVLPRAGLASDPGTVGIISILVFGAATNYALLLIARYREELRVTARPADAMRHALERAGGAVLASAGTVVLGLLALLLAATEFTQALGAGAALGVVVAMLAGLVVLPSALVLLGRAAFWPFVPRLGSVSHEGRLWARLGGATARRPGVVAAAGAALLVLLALPVVGLQTGLTENEQFREPPEAVIGAQRLAEAFPAGALSPAVILATPETADDVLAAARAVPGVAEARAGQPVGELAQVTAVIDAEPRSAASYEVVRELRSAVADVPGSQALVGGQVAADLDRSDAESRDRSIVIPTILALVLLVLVVLLRSLVAPVLLLAAVVGTFFASVGASWLIFRTVFDFPAVETPVLLLSFVFLVALGVDYSIFLTTRAREEAAVHGTPQGMLTALRVTGGVITSAGVVLAAVFTVLGVLPIILLTQIGVIVAVGVLLDTLVVRTLIVPALAFRLGPRFWWPASVDPVEQARAVERGVPPSSVGTRPTHAAHR
jgi:RND superfamily putative drug exporter